MRFVLWVMTGAALLGGCKDKEKEARIAAANAAYAAMDQADQESQAKFAKEAPALLAAVQQWIAAPPTAKAAPPAKGAEVPTTTNALVFPTDAAALKALVDDPPNAPAPWWWVAPHESDLLKALRTKSTNTHLEATAFGQVKYVVLVTTLAYLAPKMDGDAFVMGARTGEARLYTLAGTYLGGVRFGAKSSKQIGYTDEDGKRPDLQPRLDLDLAMNFGDTMFAALPTVVGAPLGKLERPADAGSGSARKLAGPSAGEPDPLAGNADIVKLGDVGLVVKGPVAVTPGWLLHRAHGPYTLEAPVGWKAADYDPKQDPKATQMLLQLESAPGAPHANLLLEQDPPAKLQTPDECKAWVAQSAKDLQVAVTSAATAPAGADGTACVGTFAGTVGGVEEVSRMYAVLHGGHTIELMCEAPKGMADPFATCDRAWQTRTFE